MPGGFRPPSTHVGPRRLGLKPNGLGGPGPGLWPRHANRSGAGWNHVVSKSRTICQRTTAVDIMHFNIKIQATKFCIQTLKLKRGTPSACRILTNYKNM